MHFLLFYDTAPDYLERRPIYRNEHLSLAWAAQARGELILGGALGDPVEGAILLFEGESPEAAICFAESDPYVKNGLIKSWRVLPWATVVGDRAVNPVKPV